MRSHLSSSLSRQRYRWRNQEALPHLEVARDVEHGQHIDHARIVTELTCRQRHFPQTAQILLGQWMVGASEQSHGVGASHARSVVTRGLRSVQVELPVGEVVLLEKAKQAVYHSGLPLLVRTEPPCQCSWRNG